MIRNVRTIAVLLPYFLKRFGEILSEKDRSLLWHWIWCESGKPNSGFIYDIMKHTRHQYHYVVRCCKKNKLKIQKEKLAKNISHTKDFLKELKKINLMNKITTEVMDDEYGNENITTLFKEKFETLYNSVPTNDIELTEIQDVIDRGISYDEFNRFRTTLFIIVQCIIQ